MSCLLETDFMKLKRELQLTLGGKTKIIRFGEAETEEELNKIFKLRFDSYSSKGYIDPTRFPNGLETDDYDTKKDCRYFLAELDGKAVSTIRIIFDEILPTEKYFSFNEPDEIKTIPRKNRAELGRFIVIPPDREKGIFLPRNIVMLFIFDLVVDFGINNGILGGYSFVKDNLYKKLQKMRAPIHPIIPYKQHYPNDGVIRGYFNQPENPVIPCYFVTSEFKKFIDGMFKNSWIFRKKDETKFILKKNLYTKFLKVMKII